MGIENLVDAAMQALVMNDTEAIKEILRQGSDADSIFPSVTDGRVKVSARDLFLQANATGQENFRDDSYFQPNFDDALGNVLLHLAANISDFELTRLLLEKGADVTSIDTYGRTALHIACGKASLDVVKLVTWKSPAYILNLADRLGFTPLDNACECNSPEVVQYLLSQDSSVGAKDSGRFPVLNAVLREDAEHATQIVSLLLDSGANVNPPDHYSVNPLIAALSKHIHQMRPTENSIAGQNSPYVGLCMLLIDRGSDVNADDFHGNTALHYAAIAELENVFRKILISGWDIDRCNKYGYSALHYACENGNQKLVDLLIISGANLRVVHWETTLRQWRRWQILNERNTHLLNYIIYKSKQCLSLENLCYIAIRKNIRNVGKDAIHLGLPSLLVKRLQLKE